MVFFCSDLFAAPTHSIRMVTAAIGAMVSALPGVQYGALHYRALEACRNTFLKIHRLNYDMPMTLSPAAVEDVRWWLSNVQSSSCFIHPPPVSYTYYTDASLEGWGGTDGHVDIGGRWLDSESFHHINTLELQMSTEDLISIYDMNYKAPNSS